MTKATGVKALCVGVAALALATGPALAQTTESSQSVQTTQTSPSGDATYHSEKSKTLKDDGTQTEKSRSYSQSSSGGVSARSTTRTVNPDGTETVTSHEKEVAPSEPTLRDPANSSIASPTIASPNATVAP